jgi:hypothetical protein
MNKYYFWLMLAARKEFGSSVPPAICKMGKEKVNNIYIEIKEKYK